MKSQAIYYPIKDAFLAYFGSLFIGFMTPGRLGEFVKALHVSNDYNVKIGLAFSSVLADRLFDLSVLVVFTTVALVSLLPAQSFLYLWISIMGLVLFLGALLIFFLLQDDCFKWMLKLGKHIGFMEKNAFNEAGWLEQLRNGLKELTLYHLIISGLLTATAYTVFFLQCYLLALAVGIGADFLTVTCAVAVGSFVTLIPVSISGIGTREAAIVAYLGTYEVPAEVALSFSLLVFTTFYLVGGVFGAVAWWLKPVSFNSLTQKGER